MTNDQDLSLLTDKERVDLDSLRNALENDAAQLTREFHKVHLESVERWVTRLIAARAENKRKDEMLAKAEEALIWASGAFQSEEESAAWAAHGRPIVDEMRALLQSEKGGE